MASAETHRTPGLRERKKQRTRELIAETARRLFVERGFERVSVAEIARLAEVSEKTVFNYFPTKEDLVYWRLESFEEELLAAIRDRQPSETVLDAFSRFVTQPRGLLAADDPKVIERLAGVTRMITDSPALLARERQVFDRYTATLAAALAQETGAAEDDVEPWVVANAMMGVHRGLVDFSRRRILAGVRNPELGREMREQARRALSALERGL
jgi:AcrR family transcriptional regulator